MICKAKLLECALIIPADRDLIPGQVISYLPYLPTPPLGQDMTQGQFLSGV